MATIGQALTERACTSLRETLETLGGDPEIVKRAVDFKRAQMEHDHCQQCGTFLVDRADGSKASCVHCNRERRPWPKSRQGYRPR